ncbi:MAG: hypothetical protein GKR89_11455 [Candidatus Latescibacteria bacterium]|nr:hypothetical protein [Candidatus Latescibacterota bacterium]
MSPGKPKKLAAISTVIWKDKASHARTIVGKYLFGFNEDGQAPGPRCQIASLYTHQTPGDDISRAWSEQAGVPVFRTVHEALTLGGDALAVDGVLLIAEHGDYEFNDKEQKLYPRFELFLQIVDTFRRSGRAVPVFNDKHLSYSWGNAQRMYELAQELDFAFMAGSSIPVNYRAPEIEFPWGARTRHGVVVAPGPIDSYGFHMLETVQCLIERRAGGETGVVAVQCLEGADIWRFLDNTPWAQRLFEAALACSQERRDDLRSDPKAALFRVWHRDGVETAIFRLPAGATDFCVAVDVEGQEQPLSTMMWRNKPDNRSFDGLILGIDEMFHSGVATYPVERTLLVSGILDTVLESRLQGHVRLDTPQLDISYQVGQGSFHCTGEPPEPWLA